MHVAAETMIRDKARHIILQVAISHADEMREGIMLDHCFGNPDERHRIFLLGKAHGGTDDNGPMRQIGQAQHFQGLVA